MSKPFSSMVNREDRGLVYSSIQNDGTVIHWCDKCEKIWISKETQESNIKRILTREKYEEFYQNTKTAINIMMKALVERP